MAFGRLEDGRRPARPISDINITPLVDVMLVLVVIFILTAPMLASSIRLDLPQTPGTALRPERAPAPHLVLAVDRSGQAFLDDQAVSLADLEQRLAQAAAADASTELRLHADQAAPYGRVAEVLSAAQKAGLYRIGFLTEPTRPAPTPASAYTPTPLPR